MTEKNQIVLSGFSNLPTPTGFEMFTLHVVSQSFLYVKQIRLEYVYNLYIHTDAHTIIYNGISIQFIHADAHTYLNLYNYEISIQFVHIFIFVYYYTHCYLFVIL